MECSTTTASLEPRNNEIDITQPIMKSALQDLPCPPWAVSMLLRIENLEHELKLAKEFTSWTAKGFSFNEIFGSAIRKDHLPLVQYCNAICGQGINERNSSDQTLLDQVVLINNEDHQVLDWILSNPNVKINSANFTGHTALHLACKKGNVYAVQTLLNAGADTSLYSKGFKKWKPIELVDLNKKSGKEI